MKLTLRTINLEVTDVARSKLFYVNVLKMDEDLARSHPPSFAYLTSAAAAITLTTPPDGGELAPSRSIEIGFETDDIEQFEASLKAAGISGRRQSMGWGDAVELSDPDGHRIIVYAFRAG